VGQFIGLPGINGLPYGRRYAAFWLLAFGCWLLAVGCWPEGFRYSMLQAPSPHPRNSLKSVESSSSTPSSARWISSKRGSDNIDNIDNIDNFSVGEQGSCRKENIIVFIVFIVFIVSLKNQ
jgi:hypothetical protein